MSLNPTALKLTAPTVKVCTKGSMSAMRLAFVLDLAATTTTTVIPGSSRVSSGMMVSADVSANRF